jgi:hypothetical protein
MPTDVLAPVQSASYKASVSRSLIIIQLVLYVALIIAVLLSPRRFIYDEVAYIQDVSVIHNRGLSLGFVSSLNGAAGPLYGATQAAFEPFTHLHPVRARLVSLLCFALAVYILYATMTRLGYGNAAALALAAISIPMNWVQGGLALTEAPAVLLATMSLCCLCLSRSQSPAFERNRFLLMLAAGALMGIAATGRQPFALLAVVPLCVSVIRRESLREAAWYFILALLPFLCCVIIWHGLFPPSQNSPDAPAPLIPFVPVYGIYSLGYAGMAGFIVAPRFFAFKPLMAICAAISIVAINLWAGIVAITPMLSASARVVPTSYLTVYARASGALVLICAVGFCAALIRHAWLRRHEFIPLTAILSCAIICVSPAFIPFQYSSRYTALFWPFFLVAVKDSCNSAGFKALLAIAGGMVGLTSLLAYYSSG